MKRRRPHQLRFLLPLRWAILTLTLAWALDGIQSAVCSLQQTGGRCAAVVPGWMAVAVAVAIALSVAASAYRYWLDFFQGEYYLDLVDPHWRDR